MRLIVRGCRAVIRALITRRTSVPRIEKVVRSVLLVPVFGAMLILLRARALLRGRLGMDAVTGDGFRFTCQLPDLIHMYVYLFGVWEPDLAKCIRTRLAFGDVFVDVGANIGFDTLIASQAVGGMGRVVAIEPSPSVFEHLAETLRLNGHPVNVRTENHAAAGERGTMSLFAGPQHNTGLTTTVPRAGFPRETTVHAAPLDELLTDDELRRARLVKIDVEGGEDAVLAGCRRLLAEGREDLEFLIELSPTWWSDRGKRPIDVLQPFLAAGFHVYELPNNYWPWRYLWPEDVQPPRRSHRDFSRRVARLDVLLSTRDAEVL